MNLMEFASSLSMCAFCWLLSPATDVTYVSPHQYVVQSWEIVLKHPLPSDLSEQCLSWTKTPNTTLLLPTESRMHVTEALDPLLLLLHKQGILINPSSSSVIIDRFHWYNSNKREMHWLWRPLCPFFASNVGAIVLEGKRCVARRPRCVPLSIFFRSVHNGVRPAGDARHSPGISLSLYFSEDHLQD
jgi:hypothetical protein